jgi:hypothetical protein
LLETIVGKRLADQMERKRKELERFERLQRGDPNDPDIQKEIEEEIRRNLVDQNY